METYTPIELIPEIHASLRKAFRSGITQSLEWRRRQLYNLARFAQEQADAIADCAYLDLGRAKQETFLGDVVPIAARCVSCAQSLEEWVGEQSVDSQDWQKGWNPRVRKDPKGVVLIIAPWNCPIGLCLQPLYGAIAAGCCVLMKVSEVTPHCARFLRENLGKYIDPNCFQVVFGDVPLATKILELKWDHISYTGNARIARVVSRAAAEHLTPLTLELGGKSPVILDDSADLSIAAKRVLFGKALNSGQICVAPDYVLAPARLIPGFVDHLKYWRTQFYPGENGEIGSENYTKIVSDTHFKRLTGLLDRTEGTVVMGGSSDADKRKVQLTVVTDVRPDDALMEGEIFGPILPILSVKDVHEAIDFVNEMDHPLVIYAFSSDQSINEKIIKQTTSGGVTLNETVGQLSLDNFPLGGVGESGYGTQVLRYGIDNFIYSRGIVDIPYTDEPYMGLRYPPYSSESLAAMSAFKSLEIPVMQS